MQIVMERKKKRTPRHCGALFKQVGENHSFFAAILERIKVTLSWLFCHICMRAQDIARVGEKSARINWKLSIGTLALCRKNAQTQLQRSLNPADFARSKHTGARRR